MLVKIFSNSEVNGDKLLNYLFSEHSHEAYKPQLVEGNREITKNIINNITNKHKYVAGCLAFAHDEHMTPKQEKEIINHFEKTFAPFKDEGRVNFLWVRHMDKGRLELNFVTPRLDLKTQKSFNPHPPGEANKLMFNTWARLQNHKYGFKQIDKTETTPFELKLSMTVLQDLYQQRKDYISRVFDKPEKTHNNKYYDRTRKTKSTNKQLDPQLRKLNTSLVKSNVSSSVSATRNNEISTNSARHDFAEQEGFKHLSNNFKSNANEIECLFRNRGKLTNGTGKSKTATNTNGLSLEEEIRQLALSLNECEIGQGASIVAKLNMLQGQLSRQQAPKQK